MAVKDGHERFDYVMTKVLNRNKPGGIYQCEKDSMPKDAFVRAGYYSFSNMLKPVLDDPSKFSTNLTDGMQNYKGKLMLMSSECSFIGYDYQERLHIPLLPAATVHLKAPSMGHNMLTLNPQWSYEKIGPFSSNIFRETTFHRETYIFIKCRHYPKIHWFGNLVGSGQTPLDTWIRK